MIRTLTLATCFLLVPTLYAQIWCAPGARWSTDYSDGWITDGSARFTYVGDTVIAGLPSQKIAVHAEGTLFGTPFSYDLNPFFTTVSGDLVSCWTGVGFDTLYAFGAGPGDSWYVTLEGGGDSGYPQTVLDTGTTIIDGIALHYLATDIDTIVERLGTLHHLMWPWQAIMIDAPDGPLRCYQDIDIDFHSSAWPGVCDFGTGMPGPEEELVQLQPNPGTDQLTVRLPSGEHALTLFDATGRAVLHLRTQEERITIDTSQLPAGVYTLRVGQQERAFHWVRMQ